MHPAYSLTSIAISSLARIHVAEQLKSGNGGKWENFSKFSILTYPNHLLFYP
jgi:hypothetical protein